MKKWLGNLLLGLVLLCGIALFSYPAVSNWINTRIAFNVIGTYQEQMEQLSDEEIESRKAAAKEYNESLSNGRSYVPYGDEERSSIDLLDPGEMLGYLEIPKISVNLPIYEGTSAAVLQKGVGHLINTSLPVGGKGSHVALSAHRGLPAAKLFTDLDKLEEGDYFYVYAMDETLAYQVDKIQVIDPYIGDELDIEKDRDYVTLITCTPLGVNSHRLLVRGVRVAYEQKTADELDEMYQAQPDIRWYLVALMAACILGIFFEMYRVRKRANHEKRK